MAKLKQREKMLELGKNLEFGYVMILQKKRVLDLCSLAGICSFLGSSLVEGLFDSGPEETAAFDREGSLRAGT